MASSKKIIDIADRDAFSLLGIPRFTRKPRMYRKAALMYTSTADRKILYRTIAAKKPGCVLEIGTCYGHTAYGFKVNSPGSKIYTIDINKEMGIAVPDKQKNQLLPVERVGIIFRERNSEIEQVFGDSRDISTYAGLPDFDFAFIDGNHSARAIIADTGNVFRKTRRNAVIFWHDYRDDGLAETIPALREIVRTHGIQILHITGSMLAFTVKNRVFGF